MKLSARSAVLVLIAATVLFVALTPVRAFATGAVSPQRISLQRADLPGFRQGVQHSYTNMQAARMDHVPLAAFVRHGRLTSYRVSFVRSSTLGVFVVESTVAAFRMPSGAHWDYTRVVQNARHSNAQSRTHRFVESPIGFLGRERTVLRLNGRFLTVMVVRFDRGRYRVTLKVVANAHRVWPGEPLAFAIRLAGLMDRRVQSTR